MKAIKTILILVILSWATCSFNNSETKEDAPKVKIIKISDYKSKLIEW